MSKHLMRWSLALAASLLVAACGGSSGGSSELVKNGNFSAGIQNWDSFGMNGGAVTLVPVDGSLGIEVTAAGTSTTDVQVKYMGGLPLTKGKTYRFSFVAAAPVDRAFDTSIWENGHDTDGNGFYWSTYQYDGHVAGASGMAFSVDFTMGYDNHDAGIAFFVGGSTVPLIIDDVSVQEVTN